MRGESRLRPVEDVDPIWRLWQQLPPEWRGPIIGDTVEDLPQISPRRHRLDLTGVPDLIAAELAWMAHWQAQDGTRLSVQAFGQFASILRLAIRQHHPFPSSMRAVDWLTASALQGWFYARRWRRLPPARSRERLRRVFGFAHLALVARCHEGAWWQLDEWNPRCDPRIPLAPREPSPHNGCSPGALQVQWLRAAVKWHLCTALESGMLRWTTVSHARMQSLHRFETWLTTLDDPSEVLDDAARSRQHAAAFARWTAQAPNRTDLDGRRRPPGTPVPPRLVNDDLRAVAELFAFAAANPVEARTVLGIGPWQHVTDLHAAAWFRQVSRVRPTRPLTDEHYVDDHALAQITVALPLLGTPRDEQMLITRGDGQQVAAAGLGDPQAMRMVLLQILTGRRASEVRTCDADCIQPVIDATTTAAGGEQVARFRYAQSKIDIAPDSILVDHEVTPVVEEQRLWVREQLPDRAPRHLFLQRSANRHGDKPYSAGSYIVVLRQFSDLVQITDSKGRLVRLNHTHRFRHAKLTRRARPPNTRHPALRRPRHADHGDALHRPARGARRVGVPGNRQAARGRHGGAVLPRGP